MASRGCEALVPSKSTTGAYVHILNNHCIDAYVGSNLAVKIYIQLRIGVVYIYTNVILVNA